MEAVMATQVQPAVQQAAAAQQLTGSGTQLVNSMQQAGGGMFAALLQQMLGGNGQTALLGTGAQQKVFLVEQMRKQLGEEGVEAGMQLLAEMIAMNPSFVQQVDTSELVALMGQATQPGVTAEQTAMQNLAAAQQLQQAVAGAAGQTAQAGTFAQLAAQEAVPGQSVREQALNAQAKQSGSSGAVVTSLNELRQAVTQTAQAGADTAQGGAAQEDGLTGQAQFQRALFQAQQKLTKNAGTEANVEAISGQKQKKEADPAVDNVLQFPAQTKLEQLGQTKELSGLNTVDAKDLLQQVKTGLTNGMHSGKNEFIIKLKPEGLGEITVRMLEEAGKITMSITTANAQTQRILNNEIAALRDAVRPYNVEVQHVESQNTQHFNLDQQKQGFAQQQGQQNRQPQQQGQSWYSGLDVEDEQQDAAAQAMRYTENGLNTVV